MVIDPTPPAKTSGLHPKLIGAGAGIGLGSYVSTLVMWALNSHGITPPAGVEQAIGGILDTLFAIGLGWYMPAK